MANTLGFSRSVHATDIEPPRLSMQDMTSVRDSIEKPLNGRPSLLSDEYDEADDDDDDDTPTEDEKRTLRRVADKLPWSAFLVAVVELCERFAYYGLSGPFQNYISNKYNDPSGLPGAIGLGQAGATALTNFFQFWCYVTPIIGELCSSIFFNFGICF